MQEKFNRRISRREFLAGGVTMGVGIGLVACGVEDKYPSNPITDAEPTQAPSPTPELVQKLTPQERMLAYAKEVLKPEFIPQALDNIVIEPYGEEKDQKLYRTGGRSAQGVNIAYLYLESVKSNRFKEDALPLDITMSIYYQGNLEVIPTRIQELFDRHFVKASQTGQSSLDNFTVPIGGVVGSAWETVWENEDGTKDSRWVIKFETKDSSGNIIPRFVVSATKIFKDNPLYEKNTAMGRG